MTTHRRITVIAMAAALATVLASCNDPAVFESNGVHVTKDAQGLNVSNTTDKSLGVAAFDEDILPLIEWIKCANTTPACLRLVPGGTLRIPFSQIVGSDRSGRIVVYAWTVVSTPGGLTTSDVATVRVGR
jgi:hypothetical protein